MDKRTLSQYGWGVVIIIIIIILLGLATPFANFIRANFREFGFATSEKIEEDLDTYVTPYNYTIEEINSLPNVYGIGATKPEYVIAKFNSDYSKVMIAKNGADSDGLIKSWSDGNNLTYAEQQQLINEYCQKTYGKSYSQLVDEGDQIKATYSARYLQSVAGLSQADVDRYETILANPMDYFFTNVYGVSYNDVENMFSDEYLNEMVNALAQHYFNMTSDEMDAYTSDDYLDQLHEDMIQAAFAQGMVVQNGDNLSYGPGVNDEVANQWIKNFVEAQSDGVITFNEMNYTINSNPYSLQFDLNLTEEQIKTFIESYSNGLLTFTGDIEFNVTEEEYIQYIEQACNGYYVYNDNHGEFEPTFDLSGLGDYISAQTNGLYSLDSNGNIVVNVPPASTIISESDSFTSPLSMHASSLSKVVFKDGVYNVGSHMFADCSNIKYLELGSTAIKYTDTSFLGLPSTLDYLGVPYIPMSYDTTMKARHFLDTVSTVKVACLNNCFDKFTDEELNAKGVYKETPHMSKKLTWSFWYIYSWNCTLWDNAELIKFNGIDYVNSRSIQSCNKLTNVDLNGIKIIEESFNYCPNLKLTEVPKTVRVINSSFNGNGSPTTDFVIPASVEYCGDSFSTYRNSNKKFTLVYNENAYYGYPMYEVATDIIIPEGTKTFNVEKIMDDNAFYGYQGIKYGRTTRLTRVENIVFPSSLEQLGEAACCGFTALKSVNIPSKVSVIPISAFSDCPSLTEITIPSNVQIIEEFAFRDSNNLTSITLNEGLKVIEFNAFYGCSKIASLIIPDSVTSLGRAKDGTTSAKYYEPHDAGYYQHSASVYAPKLFDGCSSLESITFGSGLKTIDVSCYNLLSLKNVYIKDGPTVIEQSVFENCSNLETIRLPETLKIIMPLALYGCSSLQELIIPDNTEIIGYQALGNTSSLERVTLPITIRGIICNKYSKNSRLYWNSASSHISGAIVYASASGTSYTSSIQNVTFTKGCLPTITYEEISNIAWGFTLANTAPRVIDVREQFTRCTPFVNPTSTPITITFKDDTYCREKWIISGAPWIDDGGDYIPAVPACTSRATAIFEGNNFNFDYWRDNTVQPKKIIANTDSTACQYATQYNYAFETA